jgi:peptidoglycan/xylan/chitin deacetylase (PgdA/CDA1 family)
LIIVNKRNILEWLSVIGMSILLLTLALILFLNIDRNYMDIHSVFGSVKEKIYILESTNTKRRLKQVGVDPQNYSNNIKFLKSILQKKGFEVVIIDESNLDELTSNDILLVIDSIAISKNAQKEIISFVKNGGRLLFNFESGFTDEKGNFLGPKMIEEITSLKQVGYVRRDKDHTFFLVSKLLSPISIPNGKRLDVALYDQIPVFKGKEPYLKFVNWGMNEPIKDKNRFLPSGALWSGYYGKGGWVYFSFPFYALDSTASDSQYYHIMFDNVINYLYKGVKAVAYPYIHYKKMVFVSEDTEFKFKNLGRFANLAKKYDMNVTAFCVGRLAEKYPGLMKMVGSMKNVEIASHSYSHTKLIDKTKKELIPEIELNKELLLKLSNQEVVGFRPPREEINKKMFEMLEKNHYQYILWNNFGQLDGKIENGLFIVPRIGTDDYGYLIKLDWDKDKIVSKIKEEAKFITDLNAIYSLSTHTHLMCYKSNISILEKAFKFFKKEKYPLLKGKDIVYLVKQRKNLKIEVVQTKANFILKIKNKNHNDVKNLKIRLFFSKRVNITDIVSEFTGLKINLIKYKNKDYVDIEIKKLKNGTDYNLFLTYK